MKFFRLKRQTPADVVFNIFLTIFMLALVVVTMYPILNTVAISFNDGTDTLRGGIYLWPRVPTWYNYQSIFKTANLSQAFIVSIARTVIGSVLNVFCTAMVAYTLTKKDFVFRKAITLLYVLTMYVGAGLIPGYLLNKNLHLINSFWVYIIPGLVSAFDLIIVRTYMKSIPGSLVESAQIDGAGEFTIFIKIMLPLAAPVLATIALFCAVGQWNSWFDTFIYNGNNKNLTTLQYELMKALSTAMSQGGGSNAQYIANADTAANQVTPMSIRAAITVVAAVPILCVYPFLQKYFVQGMTLGSVKE